MDVGESWMWWSRECGGVMMWWSHGCGGVVLVGNYDVVVNDVNEIFL